MSRVSLCYTDESKSPSKAMNLTPSFIFSSVMLVHVTFAITLTISLFFHTAASQRLLLCMHTLVEKDAKTVCMYFEGREMRERGRVSSQPQFSRYTLVEC